MDNDYLYLPAVVAQSLRHTGVFAAVKRNAADRRLWEDCRLAILVENRLGELADPRLLGDDPRADWAHAAHDNHGDDYEHCYWLMDGIRRVGSVALSRVLVAGNLARVSSLYVYPDARRQGVARRAIGCIRDACGEGGLTGLCIETQWTWPTPIACYLRLGMWVRMWKRGIEFWSGPEALAPTVQISDHEAHLSVSVGGRQVVLCEARREGDRLVMDDAPRSELDDFEPVGAYAKGTLALCLAMQGWPLVRSREHWKCGVACDGGPPESLASRIQRWEAWERRQGWRVSTPRIAGLDYPSWEQLVDQARVQRALAQLKGRVAFNLDLDETR